MGLEVLEVLQVLWAVCKDVGSAGVMRVMSGILPISQHVVV